MRLILFVTLLLFTACGNYFEKKNQNNDLPPVSQGTDKPAVVAEGVAFSIVKAAVFEASCVKCHQNYSFYDSVKQDLDSIIQTIETDRMPKNGPALTASQKKLLNDWVKGGAVNIVEAKPDDKPLEPVKPPVDDKLVANWNSLSRKIFFARCTTCHNPNGEAKFLDLMSRQKIFEARNKKFGTKTLLDFENVENSYMLEVIQDPEEPMPPKSSKFAQLTKDEVNVLKEWISLGLP